MFHVPLTGISVSGSAVALVHNLVLPRILTTICGQSDLSSIGSCMMFNLLHLNSGRNYMKLELNHSRIMHQ
jgi:hypothetical protein